MSYALITGASSGIGRALAYEFAKAKINLVLVARSGDALAQISQDIATTYGIECLFIADDLVHHTVPYNIYQMCKDKNLQIDYLVNNAGFGDFGPFLRSASQKDLSMIDLNVRVLTMMTKLFLQDMVERGYGRIMNVASTAAFQPGPLMSIYFATKAYVLSFSEGIAEELVGTGVTVTVLCPGPTESGFRVAAASTQNAMIKGKKLPTSEQVASYGFKAMMKGQRVAVHGFMNRLMASTVGLLPRTMVAKMIKKMQTA